jgi:ABC-type lipoprotein export system ATPase subunit
MPMIEIKNLNKTFKDGNRENRLFRELNLSIEAGDFVAFTGRSGCGKTTLLNMIGGLDQPDDGEVLVAGTAINLLSPTQRARFLNANVGFIFQSHYLLPEQTALANVMLPLRIAGRSTAEARPRAQELLEKLNLSERINAYPSTMSGGECQRVAIARALANRPKVLLADEPTASLNTELKEQVLQDLMEISRKEGATVIMVTHDISLIEPKPGRPAISRRIDIQKPAS